jgi:hypothetical protein
MVGQSKKVGYDRKQLNRRAAPRLFAPLAACLCSCLRLRY